MFCRNCGSQIREGASFCTKCGTKLSTDGTAPVSAQPNPNTAQNVPSYTLTLARKKELIPMGKTDVTINGLAQTPIRAGEEYTYTINTPNVNVVISLPGYIASPLKLNLQLTPNANVQFAVRDAMITTVKKIVLIGISGATVIQ